MTGSRRCPICDGAKRPSAPICAACAIIRSRKNLEK